MIILRYLSRELLVTSFAITAVLVVVVMSADFTRYLWQAISGKIDTGVLLVLISYRIPNSLELILPLAFFVAILMVYGRLYTDQEMTVLFSCGFSRIKMVRLTYVSALLVALLTAIISLWLKPYGLQEAERIKQEQQSRSELDLLQTLRFQISRSGDWATYIEPQENEDEQASLGKVFIASMNQAEDKNLFVIRADKLSHSTNDHNQQKYLLLEQGQKYQGQPGATDYQVTTFRRFAQRLESPELIEFSTNDIEALSSIDLWQKADRESLVELQWRISLPIIVFVLSLLGVALSHTTPRRGRYAMLLPSILIYLIYIVILNATRGVIIEGGLPLSVGLWSVHISFLLLGVIFFVLRGGIGWRNKTSKERLL